MMKKSILTSRSGRKSNMYYTNQ